MREKEFPTGNYDIFYRDEISEVLDITSDSIIDRRTGLPPIGIIKVSILQPSDGGMNSKYPFIMWRSNKKEVQKGLCNKCAQKSSRELLEEATLQKHCCSCSDENRALITTTTCQEISYALKNRGIVILTIFEAYLYKKQEKIFTRFIDSLYSFMTTASNLTEERERKKFSKKVIVSCFGKLGQRTMVEKNIKCFTNEQLVDTLTRLEKTNKPITNLDFSNASFVQVTTEKNQSKSNLKRNVIISAHITSYIREHFDRLIMNILSKF